MTIHSKLNDKPSKLKMCYMDCIDVTSDLCDRINIFESIIEKE